MSKGNDNCWRPEFHAITVTVTIVVVTNTVTIALFDSCLNLAAAVMINKNVVINYKRIWKIGLHSLQHC